MKKSFVWLLVVGLLNGSAFASNVDQRMTGDTIGAALGHLAHLQSSLARALEIKQVDVLGQPSTSVKYFCSEVGGAVASAFAVQREIRFYTKMQDEDTAATMILNLIDRTADVRNDFCAGDSIGLVEAKARLNDAVRISRDLTGFLERTQGK